MATTSTMEEKETMIINLSKEIIIIANENHLKIKQLMNAQIFINVLKEYFEKEHWNWCTA